MGLFFFFVFWKMGLRCVKVAALWDLGDDVFD